MTAGHADEGKLLGIVSRRDLLTVFLRPDAGIAADVRRVLDDIVLSGAISEPGEADVRVRNGVVTLTGRINAKAGPHGDLIPPAVRLMWDVDGVVDIVDELDHPVPGPAAQATADGLAHPGSHR